MHRARPHAPVTVMKVAVIHVVLDALVVVMPDATMCVIRVVVEELTWLVALHVVVTVM